MRKVINKKNINVDLVKDKDYILWAIAESEKVWWNTSIENAYIEWLNYVNNLEKNVI